MGGGVIQWAISRPVTVTVGVILVVMFGALSVAGIPIQLTPDVEVPTVSVDTTWPGATPNEVETEILEEQEEALKSLPGLVRMTSEARQDRASITLELEVGASLDEALVRVSNLLSQVPDYPPTARQPVITTGNAAGPPLAVIVIQSEPPGRSVAEYRSWVEDEVVPRFERIRGVASIRLRAGRDAEVHVDYDPSRLAAVGVGVGQIATRIRAELADVSAGDIPLGKHSYIVRTEVKPADPRDLDRTVLKADASGRPVTLDQVGSARPGLRKPDAVGLVNGNPTLALLFAREAGSNVLEVTQEIYRVTAELQEQLLAPEGLSMRIVSDQVDYITGALDLVEQNLVLGGALAIVVLLLFLRSVGASAIVAVSIPVSIVGTVLGMSLMGRTINIVSLAGMAFAVGMVVDNSIVVLENIDTWRRREPDIRKAALFGTREVWGAILASTLTTAAVFLPIIGWEDEVGELLRDVAVAISVAVFASLVVSVLVIPSFSARLLRNRTGTPDVAAATAAARRGIRGAVHWIVRSTVRCVVVSAVALGGAWWVAEALLPPIEYLPTGNRNVVFGVVLPPPGYSVEEMEAIGRQVQDRLVPHIGVERDGIPALDRSFFVGGADSAFMGAVAVDPARVGEVAAYVRKVLGDVPDIFGFANQASLFGGRLGGGRSIEVDISGTDLQGMVTFGGRVLGAIKQALPDAQVRPIPSLDAGAPEFRVEPKRAEAARVGLTSAEIGLIVDSYVDGAIIGELGREGEPKRNVVLRATGFSIDSPETLRAAPVATPVGSVVPLGEVATVEETLGPTVIQHIERRRAITLQVSPPEDLPFEAALSTIRDDILGGMADRGEIPAGVRIDYSGSAGKLQDAKGRFAEVLILAVIISFLLLAALFEDFLAPLAILTTVPLAGAGGVIGLRLVDATLGRQPLDMMTALGFVILIGVVVNNAILVVDGALARMREADLPLAEAVPDAVRARVRPIFMSALTSLAGLLPLVLFPGSGSELYRGVGAIVLGGLAFSTVLTLFVVPAVFTLLWRLRGVA